MKKEILIVTADYYKDIADNLLLGATVYLDKENYLLTTSNRIKFNNINSGLRHNLYFIRVVFSRMFNFYKNMYKYISNRYFRK